MNQFRVDPDSVSSLKNEADDTRLLRALHVLDVVSQAALPVSNSQLTVRTGIPKASMVRLTKELASVGYLSELPGQRGWVPGPRAAGLSLQILGNGQFRRECRAILRRVVEQTGETCNLTVRDGDNVRYIERIETQEPLRLHLEVGSKAPLHCTAGGKLFLSQLGAQELASLLKNMTLEKRTPSTIIDPSKLTAVLAKLRTHNVGVDNEEFVTGMVGVAVPIRSPDGTMIAALVCHAASARTPLHELEGRLPILQAAIKPLEMLLNSIAV